MFQRTESSPPLKQPSDRGTLYRLKPAFVAALGPVRDRLVALGVQPDHLTLTAIPVQLTMAACLVAGLRAPVLWLAVPPLALILMALNALDGSLARETQAGSVRGAALNEMVDRIGDLLVLGAGFFVAPVPIAVAAFAAVAASEMVSLIGWATTGQRVLTGMMGKPDRAGCLGAGAALAIIWAPMLTATFAVIAAGALTRLFTRSRDVLAGATAVDTEGLR